MYQGFGHVSVQKSYTLVDLLNPNETLDRAIIYEITGQEVNKSQDQFKHKDLHGFTMNKDETLEDRWIPPPKRRPNNGGSGQEERLLDNES